MSFARRHTKHKLSLPLSQFKPRSEFRVAYRRHSWSLAASNKVRRFARLADAERFLAKLRRGRDDLSPLVYSVLEFRQIYAGRWSEFHARGTKPRWVSGGEQALEGLRAEREGRER